MVERINRTWVGGLSSGLDTQGLIDKLIKLERKPIDELERRRNTLLYQKSLLQEINLKLFELQNKATDLTFSSNFKAKLVSSTNDKVISATATTEAKVGNYNIKIKQLATATKLSTNTILSSPIERGHFINSNVTLDGTNIKLSSLNINSGALSFTINSNNFIIDLSNLSQEATVNDIINSINSQINNTPALHNKVRASYDFKTNKIRFSLLDNNSNISISDQTGNLITQFFEPSGSITLSPASPVRASNLITLNTGTNTSLANLGIYENSKIILLYGSSSVQLSLDGLNPNSKISDLIEHLNKQIDQNTNLVKNGILTGKPEDRLLEFRYDNYSKKIILTNLNTNSTVSFTLTDDTVSDPNSNLVRKLFNGSGVVNSIQDYGLILANENFSKLITSGTFTIDGYAITVNAYTDTLQSVLDKINNLTNLHAFYDSKNDTIKITRKDGSSNPIALGSPNDTSNFLQVTNLITGSQAAPAKITSSTSLGLSLIQVYDVSLNQLTPPLSGPISSGTLRITINGQSTDISYTGNETLWDILKKIRNINGIEDAYYDAIEQKVNIITRSKGSNSSIKIEDVGGGNLASLLSLQSNTIYGQDIGTTLESSGPISGLKANLPLNQAGLAMQVTSGTFTINGVRFFITDPNSQSLDSIISMINGNKNVGVKASYNSNTGKIELTALQTGSSAISLGSYTDTSNILYALGLLDATQTIGKNAIYSIEEIDNGIEKTSQTNVIADVIPGVTLTLKDTTGNSFETITVKPNIELAKKNINDFIKLYNETISLIHTRLTEKRDFTLSALTDEEKKALKKEELEEYERKFKIGLLAGDSTLSMVRSRMRIAMASVVKGLDNAFDSLADIGISTGIYGSGYQDTQVGLLRIINEEKLDNALNENIDKVFDLFAKSSNNENSKGIARRLKDILNEFTKSDGILTRKVGKSGSANSNSEIDRQILFINKQIARQSERLLSRENSLIKMFSDLEAAISRYQSQSQAFINQLMQLTGNR